jgi:hypothetical protein
METLPISPRTEPVSIICPICGEAGFQLFNYYCKLSYEDILLTYFKCLCNKDHNSYYIIQADKDIVTYYFVYCPECKIDYKSYINSEQWKDISSKAKERAKWKCQLCNKGGDNTTLHTHHRTYENLGEEKDEDLIVLCSNCHAKFHDKVK